MVAAPSRRDTSARNRRTAPAAPSVASGVARNGIAALDLHTASIDRTWHPAAGGSDLWRLVVVGSRLYLGLHGLVALDTHTGAPLHLRCTPRPREVLALAVSGRRLLVAGRG